jgi:hypothetical protein
MRPPSDLSHIGLDQPGDADAESRTPARESPVALSQAQRQPAQSIPGLEALAADVGADDRFACRQAASGGDRVDVPLDLDAVAGARMKAAKPPSCAWMVNQRAGRSLSLRNEWATCGGAATNPPEETVIVSASRPQLEGQFALEHVEGIGVLGRARPV